MIDPMVAVSVSVASALTATALVLARKAPEREREGADQTAVPPGDGAAEARERYLNGGWH